MNKLKLLWEKIKSFVLGHKKTSIIVLIGILFLSIFVFNSKKTNTTNLYTVAYTDLNQSVKATGQVISKTDLDLSFNKAGIIKSVKVNVGDVVSSGQILATLDQGQAQANLTQAKGALLAAKAKYNKTIEGSSNEEIKLAEVALKSAQTDLDNIKNTQSLLVSNAYQNLLNSTIQAISNSTSNTQTPPTITGTYTGGKEGTITLSVYQGGNGGYFSTAGLITTSGIISTTTPQPIGDSGLYIQFPASYSFQNNWSITLPNTQASNYLSNYNGYQNAVKTQASALSSAQSNVDQKQAELDLQKAQARQPDIDIANADVISAQGALESAQANYEDTVIRSPANGTVTRVDVKYGELADIAKSVITVEDISNLYIEALINEANIAYLKLNQPVEITFDAFGKDKKFTGTIVHIDPSAQTNDGVVNYKIKVSINEIDNTIRPGMNANVNINAGTKQHVLAIPNIAITNKDGKSFVNVSQNNDNSEISEKEITTGFLGDNNLIEVTSGLNENDKIVLTVN